MQIKIVERVGFFKNNFRYENIFILVFYDRINVYSKEFDGFIPLIELKLDIKVYDTKNSEDVLKGVSNELDNIINIDLIKCLTIQFESEEIDIILYKILTLILFNSERCKVSFINVPSFFLELTFLKGLRQDSDSFISIFYEKITEIHINASELIKLTNQTLTDLKSLAHLKIFIDNPDIFLHTLSLVFNSKKIKILELVLKEDDTTIFFMHLINFFFTYVHNVNNFHANFDLFMIGSGTLPKINDSKQINDLLIIDMINEEIKFKAVCNTFDSTFLSLTCFNNILDLTDLINLEVNFLVFYDEKFNISYKSSFINWYEIINKKSSESEGNLLDISGSNSSKEVIFKSSYKIYRTFYDFPENIPSKHQINKFIWKPSNVNQEDIKEVFDILLRLPNPPVLEILVDKSFNVTKNFDEYQFTQIPNSTAYEDKEEYFVTFDHRKQDAIVFYQTLRLTIIYKPGTE